LEDSQEIFNIISIILKEEYFQVHVFGTVSEFISTFAALEPVICLPDVMLPGENGL